MIKNEAAYIKGAWNWDFLSGCFGKRIKPSDIDGIVERHDHLWIMEAKPSESEFDMGQAITLGSLVKRPGITALVLVGESGETNEDFPDCRSVLVVGGPSGLFRPRDNEWVCRQAVRWFTHADTCYDGLNCTWKLWDRGDET